ncbi:MAG: hypothetical protein ACP5UO_03390 [Thermoplasmata archaeon]
MRDIYKKMEEMERDYVHGSSWYFEQASLLIRKIRPREIEKFKDWLAALRPGMGPLRMILDILGEIEIEGKNDLAVLSKVLINERREAGRRLKWNIPGSLGTVMSISYSSAVSSIISAGKVGKVFLLRSGPGKEYKKAYEDYSSHVKVTVIPDSAMAFFMRETENVLVGFDAVHPDGFIWNKIGTYPLLLTAARFERKVFAAGESYKASLTKVSKPALRTILIAGRKVHLPLIEEAPLECVREIVTDLGVLKPSSDAVELMYKSFKEGVKNRYKEERER